jgi:fumarate reductase subunit D
VYDLATVDSAWLGAMGILTSIAGLVIVVLGLMAALGMAEHKNDAIRGLAMILGFVVVLGGIVLSLHGADQFHTAQLAHAWQTTHSLH